MSVVISVNPFRCCVWSAHNRLEEGVTELSCKAEIQSLLSHGQLVPAVGRRIAADPLYDVEIICGARRLFAARHVNLSLQVELREMSDREAAIALDIENEQRQSLSPYERGRGYAQWLKAEVFASQDDLAHTLKISKSQVSRLLALAKLPSVIVNAFASPTDICETWGPELYTVWRDPQRKEFMADAARRLSRITPRPPAPEVLRCLITERTLARKRSSRARDELVRSRSGRPLFRVRLRRQKVAILFTETLTTTSVGIVTTAIVNALERAQTEKPNAQCEGPGAKPASTESKLSGHRERTDRGAKTSIFLSANS